MKKLFALSLVILLAVTLLASPGYCQNNNWGNTDLFGLLKKVFPGYLQAAGSAFGGATSLTTSTTTMPTGYSFVRKAITDATGFTTGTLANGTPGQFLTIFITTVSGSGSYTLTPSTKTGFSSILFDTAKDQATLWYIDDTVGWVVFSQTGCTVNLP